MEIRSEIAGLIARRRFGSAAVLHRSERSLVSPLERIASHMRLEGVSPRAPRRVRYGLFFDRTRPYAHAALDHPKVPVSCRRTRQYPHSVHKEMPRLPKRALP